MAEVEAEAQSLLQPVAGAAQKLEAEVEAEADSLLQPESPNAEEVETEAEAIEPSSPSNVLYHCKYCNRIFKERGCAAHFSTKHRRDWIGGIGQFFEACYDCQDDKCTKKVNSFAGFTVERPTDLITFDTT